MRIEAITKIRATDDAPEGKRFGRNIHMDPGDVATVGPNFGKLACELGWAKDVDGEVPTGERSTKPVTVTPQNIVAESDQKAK